MLQRNKAGFRELLVQYWKRIQRKILRIPPIAWMLRHISDEYERRLNARHPRSSIKPAETGWSIVVVTSGTPKEALAKLIESARNELAGTPYEILVVGPSSLISLFPGKDIRIIPYRELGMISGWITRKKNLGVEAARYENVVVCHDYLVFTKGWKDGFDRFGNDFTVCTNKVTNMDGTRHRDWITWDYPEVGAGLLPYHAECTKYQYIGGAYFIVKRDFYLDHPLDEKLRWGEGEDVEWSLDVRNYTKFSFNPYSIVTYSKQKSPIKGEWLTATKKLEEIFQEKQ